jgi:hypothetical protein
MLDTLRLLGRGIAVGTRMAEDAIHTGLDVAAQRSKLLTQNPAGAEKAIADKEAEYATRRNALIVKDAINKPVTGMEALEAEFMGKEITEDE